MLLKNCVEIVSLGPAHKLRHENGTVSEWISAAEAFKLLFIAFDQHDAVVRILYQVIRIAEMFSVPGSELNTPTIT